MKLQQWFEDMEGLDREATKGPWYEYDDLDYYQAGTYVGAGPVKWVPEDNPKLGNKKVPCPPNEIESLNEPVFRLEGTTQDKEFLKRSRTELPRAIKIIKEYREKLRRAFVMYIEDIGTGLEDTALVADRYLRECDEEIEKILGEGK